MVLGGEWGWKGWFLSLAGYIRFLIYLILSPVYIVRFVSIYKDISD